MNLRFFQSLACFWGAWVVPAAGLCAPGLLEIAILGTDSGSAVELKPFARAPNGIVAGNGSVKVGAKGVTGDIYSGGDVKLESFAQAQDVVAGGKIKLGKNAAVASSSPNQTTETLALSPVLAAPNVDLDISRQPWQAILWGPLVLDPGAYGDVRAAVGDTLVLRSGEYDFERLRLGAFGCLRAKIIDGAPVVLRVRDGLVFEVLSHVWVDGGSGADLRIEVEDGDAKLRAAGWYHGTFVSPAGDIELGPLAQLTGAALASRVKLQEGAVLDYLPFAHDNEEPACTGDAECDDADACTVDECDPNLGCFSYPLECGEDGDLCTTNECVPSEGCITSAVDCTDGDSCTVDACDPGVGCIYAPLPCEASGACEIALCNPAAGCLVSEVVCNDGDPCTQDRCAPESGCEFSPIECSDGEPCTLDLCLPDSGCVYLPGLGCDDGDLCTQDSCVSGQGCTHTAVTCDDDGDPCTEEVCLPDAGCFSAARDCDDADECTLDTCEAELGCVHDPVVCDDDFACTIDSCAPALGCLNEPVSCEDGNPCTDEFCTAEQGCVYFAVSCDDADLCTLDVCSPLGGCSSEPASCDDGLPCTLDACDPGSGCFAAANECDDGDPCTADSCDVQGDCVFSPVLGGGCGAGPQFTAPAPGATTCLRGLVAPHSLAACAQGGPCGQVLATTSAGGDAVTVGVGAVAASGEWCIDGLPAGAVLDLAVAIDSQGGQGCAGAGSASGGTYASISSPSLPGGCDAAARCPLVDDVPLACGGGL